MVCDVTITVQTVNEDAPSFARRRFIGRLKGKTFREQLLSLLKSHDSRYGNQNEVAAFVVAATSNNLESRLKVLVTTCKLVHPIKKCRYVV